MAQDPLKNRRTLMTSGDAPINLRTAPRDLRLGQGDDPSQGVPEHLQVYADRVAGRVLGRYQLGLPLYEALHRDPASPKHVPPKAIRGRWLSCGLGGVGVVLSGWGLVTTTLPALLPGLTLIVSAGILWVRYGASSAGRSGPESFAMSLPGLSEAVLSSCDLCLEQAAKELDDDGQARLKELKAVWLELARLAIRNPSFHPGLTMEDRLYIAECMRRYVPDTLAAFLSIPKEQRSHQEDKPLPVAVELFREQIEGLRQALENRLDKAHAAGTETLRRQQRFLAAKHQPPP